jgi:YedE family putative selenium metabolism protein
MNGITAGVRDTREQPAHEPGAKGAPPAISGITGARTGAKTYLGFGLVGVAIGALAVVLQYLGNPPNMGLCLGCFLRDIAGGVGLHRAAVAQYVRPEIMGVVLGALGAALVSGQWRARGGSAPLVRFVLGVFAMAGILVYLGCPWRAMLRLGSGDLNGLLGLGGLLLGASVAARLTRHGGVFDAKQEAASFTGLVFPALMVLLLVLVVLGVRFQPGSALFFSEQGPGSMRAPWLISLAAGLAVGVMAQGTDFCVVGALREAVGGRQFKLSLVLLGILAAACVGNLLTGRFRLGFTGMPLSHTVYLWSFLGMVLCGLAFSLGQGCPGRQLVLAGEGDSDAALFCVGMLFGAGICHNWALVAAPDAMANGLVTVGGPTGPAKVAVVTGILACVAIGLCGQRCHAEKEAQGQPAGRVS